MTRDNRFLQVISLSLIGVWVFIIGMIVTNERFHDAVMLPLLGN